MKYFFLVVYGWSAFFNALAGVTSEELQMKADPSKGMEHAVILYERGIIDETFTYQMSKMNYEVKLKFFSKKGIEDYGTLVLNFTPPEENISGIEATVYLPDGKTIKLSKDDIHKKKTSIEYGQKETEISIAFPGLTEGAIVEYQYSRSFQGLESLYQWSFQGDLYCMESQVRYYPWPDLPWGVSFTNSLVEPQIEKGKVNSKRWVQIRRDQIPPIKKETHALPVSAVRESAWFFHKDTKVAKDNYWTERGDQYYKSTLKKMFKPQKELKIEDPDDPEVVQKVFSYVVSKHISLSTTSKEDRSQIDQAYLEKLSKATRISDYLDFKYLYKYQIDFVLGAYLASSLPGAIIEYAMYIPWDKGFFNTNVQTLEQFTDSMLKVTYREKVYYLSPIKRFLPVNQLPFGAYGTQLFIIGPEKVHFEQLPVPSFNLNHSEIQLELSLNEDGSKATVTRKKTLNPFASFSRRSVYSYFEEKELRDQILKDLEMEFGTDTQLNEFRLENLHELEKPLILEENFTVPFVLDEAGEYLLFKTMGLVSLTENPFNQETRIQNVVFQYPYQTTTHAVYDLGANFVIPKAPMGLKINDNIFTYEMIFKKLDDHRISVQTEEILAVNFFKPEAALFFQKSIDPILTAAKQTLLIEESQ